MADDDKGAKPETPLSTVQPVTSPTEAEGRPHSEWTASDRRGPLGSADETDADVERVVPAHETDAEGGLDPALHHPAAADAGEPMHAEGEPAADPSTPLSTAADATLSPTAVADPDRRRSLVPVAAGLVIGALVGAGSAWLVYAQSGSGAGDTQRLAALSSRVDTLEKRPDPQAELAKLQTGLTDVQGKVAALEKRPAEPGAPPAPAPAEAAKPADQASDKGAQTAGQGSQAAKPAGAADKTVGQAATTSQPASPTPGSGSSGVAPAGSDLAGKVAALQAALDELRTRTGALQAQDAKDNAAAAKVATLQSGLADAQKQASDAQAAADAIKSEQQQLGGKIAALAAAVADAQKQASGAQSGLQTVQSQQESLEGKLGSPALAVVADSLVEQIRAGQPFARQVDALAGLGADPAKVAVLHENAAHGVPSAQALLAQWKPLVDPVIATGNKAPATANFGERLEHGLFGLVNVRRADGTTGTDLASRVGLIGADLAHDDVSGAYATWQALPADAKAKSEAWGALAKTSVEALGAARELQRAAIDALGAKKS